MTDSPRGTAAETATLLLCGARLTDGRTVDVRLSGPRIEAVGTAGSLAVPAGRPGDGTRIDLRGYLLLPAPAEPHAHLDLALTAGGRARPATTVDVQRRATEAALLQLGHGATAVRSHVRVGDVRGLRSLEAVLQARHALRGLVDVHDRRRAARADRRRGRGRSGDAARRAEDGRVRGRRLPRPGPRPERVRGGRADARRASSGCRSTCTPRPTTRPGWPGSPRWPAGCGPG